MNSGQHKVKFEGLSRKSLPALSGSEGGGSILVTSNSFNTSGQLLATTQSTIIGCAFRAFRGLSLSPESTKGSMYSVELLLFPFQFRRFSRIVNVLLFYDAAVHLIPSTRRWAVLQEK